MVPFTKNSIAFLLAGISLTIASVSAADGPLRPLDKPGTPVKIQGSSTSAELPSPKTPFEGRLRAPGIGEGLDPGASLAPASPNQTSPTESRKLKELLDQERNWIFKNPYNDDYDSRTEEILGSKKDDEIDYERRALGQGDKTMLEKYLTEDEREGSNGSREKDRDRRSGRNREDADERDNTMSPARRESPLAKSPTARDERNSNPIFARDRESSFLAGREKGLFGRSLDNDGARSRFSADRIDVGRAPVEGSRSTANSASFKADQAQQQQQQQARDKEFEALIAPRHGGPSLSRAMDPINTQVDTTRIGVNPIIAGRPEAGGNSSFLGPRQSFLSESSPVSRFDGVSSVPDMVPKTPAISPITPPASSFQNAPAAAAPRPFVFEFPKRAF